MKRTCRVALVTAVAMAAGAVGAATASACVLVGFGTSGLGASGAPPGGPVVRGETIGFTLTARDVDGSTGESAYVVSLNGQQVATGTVSAPGGSGSFTMPDLGPSAQTVQMRAVLVGSDAPPLARPLDYRPPAPAGPTEPSGTPQSPVSSTGAPTAADEQPATSGSPPTSVTGGPGPSSGSGHRGTGAPKTPSTDRGRGPVSGGTRDVTRPHAHARTPVRRPDATRPHEPVVVSSPAPVAPAVSDAPAVTRRVVRAHQPTRIAGRHAGGVRTPAVSRVQRAAARGVVPQPDAKRRPMPVAHAASGNGAATPTIVLAVLLLVAAGGSAGGLWLRIRGRRPLAPPPADAVEAELQELIADESARRLAAEQDPVSDEVLATRT